MIAPAIGLNASEQDTAKTPRPDIAGVDEPLERVGLVDAKRAVEAEIVGWSMPDGIAKLQKPATGRMRQKRPTPMSDDVSIDRRAVHDTVTDVRQARGARAVHDETINITTGVDGRGQVGVVRDVDGEAVGFGALGQIADLSMPAHVDRIEGKKRCFDSPHHDFFLKT